MAESFRQDFQNAVLLAERLGVKRIVGFSGCPVAARRSHAQLGYLCLAG